MARLLLREQMQNQHPEIARVEQAFTPTTTATMAMAAVTATPTAFTAKATFIAEVAASTQAETLTHGMHVFPKTLARIAQTAIWTATITTPAAHAHAVAIPTAPAAVTSTTTTTTFQSKAFTATKKRMHCALQVS